MVTLSAAFLSEALSGKIDRKTKFVPQKALKSGESELKKLKSAFDKIKPKSIKIRKK